MREAELAALLAATASERGVPLGSAAEELAAMPLPAWLDAAVFRTSLVQLVERQLRAELESELNTLRRRMLEAAQTPPPSLPQTPVSQPAAAAVVAAPAASNSATPSPAPATPAVATPPLAPASSSPTVTEPATVPPATRAVDPTHEDPMPPDATMVWTTQHGRPPEES